MFMQYRKEFSPFRAESLENDSRLEIVHPSADQSTVIPGQDFYVIGRFHGLDVPENARFVVKLADADGKVVRTVETSIRDNVQGIKADAEGMFTDMSAEAIRESGMPDLIYDPEVPDSFYDTWNKAFYTREYFAALVYGGTYDTEHIRQTDQFGKPLSPIGEGIYVLSAELHLPGGIVRSSQTLRVRRHTKEIILSRYTSPEHSAVLSEFAVRNEFESYTSPYPGIWDPAVFRCGWKTEAYIEIPSRWEYADSMEYPDNMTHCFDFNISDECVGYRTEIGAMLSHDSQCLNDPAKVKVYYYRNGRPSLNSETSAEQLCIFEPDEYLAVTDAFVTLADPNCVEVHSVLKPIPSAVSRIAPNRFMILNQIRSVRYSVKPVNAPGQALTFECPAGLNYATDAGKEEFLLLQSRHKLSLPGKWYGEKILINACAVDEKGIIWDQKNIELTLERSKPDMVFCDVDGTLIDNSQMITPAFETLKELLKSHAIPFTIATGRSHETIRQYAEYLELDMPILVNNGANVIDHGTLLWDETFPAHLVRDAILAADQLDMAIFMCFDGKELVYRHNAYIQREIDEFDRYNHFYIPLASEWPLLNFERVMITDPEKPGRIDRIMPYLTPLEDRLSVLRYDARHVDIMNKGVSKGWGIRRLARNLGLDTAKMMVIGDGANDFEMIREVGMGAAVGNAVDALKEKADYICKAANTNGVIEALQLLWT